MVSICHFGLRNRASVWHAAAIQPEGFRGLVFSDVVARKFRPAPDQSPGSGPGRPPSSSVPLVIDSFTRDAEGRKRAEVFRFEDLDRATRTLSRRLGLPLKMPHFNATVRSDSRTYYDADTHDRVAWLFASDIEEFGYEFQS